MKRSPSHHFPLHSLAFAQDGIRTFCNEVHELYIKLLLNPFYVPGSRIDHPDFDARVQQVARRYAGYKG